MQNIVAATVPGAAAAPGGGEAARTTGWPPSLKPFGEGFPNHGDPCRRIGESAATVDFLDDSATLVGCRSAREARALGGHVVGTVDGITLVSIPGHAPPAMP